MLSLNHPIADLVGADYNPRRIDDAEAKRRFPDKGKAFLTCRNFQFGAHRFRE